MEIIATKSSKRFSPVMQLIEGIITLFSSLLFVCGFIYMITAGGVGDPIETAKGVLIFGILIISLCAIGYYFVSRYLLWRKLPQAVAEFDGHYLYIHGKKETKIHVLDLKNARVMNGVRHLRHDVFIYLDSSKRIVVPFTADTGETIGRLERIVASIKV